MLPLAVRLVAPAVLAVPLLAGCGTSDEEHERRLDAACQDNRTRAYTAAGRTTVGAGTSEADALKNMRAYVAEVRKTPVCFAQPVRREVEKAADAAERGHLLELEYPKGTAQRRLVPRVRDGHEPCVVRATCATA